ncbi:hypothetical protein [Blastococcus litoris]|uniref:hypothetical protein n=1 Tax=Blastococcus litoris TaxID=2171622 RepID=UPI000E308D5B|nr:hypothetical protein [Blastococcus litoris]
MTERSRAIAVAALVLALTGCGAGTSGLAPPTLEPTFPAEPPVAWARPGHLAVTTQGSSSCPTGPTAVAASGEQEVVLEVGHLHPDRDPCSADMAPTTTEVELPDGVSDGAEVTVRLRYSNGDEETVVLPPAGD